MNLFGVFMYMIPEMIKNKDVTFIKSKVDCLKAL